MWVAAAFLDHFHQLPGDINRGGLEMKQLDLVLKLTLTWGTNVPQESYDTMLASNCDF